MLVISGEDSGENDDGKHNTHIVLVLVVGMMASRMTTVMLDMAQMMKMMTMLAVTRSFSCRCKREPHRDTTIACLQHFVLRNYHGPKIDIAITSRF